MSNDVEIISNCLIVIFHLKRVQHELDKQNSVGRGRQDNKKKQSQNRSIDVSEANKV